MKPAMLLQTKNLSKVYTLGGSEIHALRDANCVIDRGSWTTICGPSGSGKSSLLSLLATLDRPTTGSVMFEGEDISFASDVRQAIYRKEKIGIVFQEYRLFEQVTAWENVAMPLVVTDMERGQRQTRALELLEQVGLEERANHLPRQLSGGERQRVALARALVHEPEILFADEPTANIDQDTANNVMELFRSIRSKGRTLVVVSHDPDMASRADKVLRMDNGRLIG
jgi:putative ABC transport system ATP-binding protein